MLTSCGATSCRGIEEGGCLGGAGRGEVINSVYHGRHSLPLERARRSGSCRSANRCNQCFKLLQQPGPPLAIISPHNVVPRSQPRHPHAAPGARAARPVASRRPAARLLPQTSPVGSWGPQRSPSGGFERGEDHRVTAWLPIKCSTRKKLHKTDLVCLANHMDPSQPSLFWYHAANHSPNPKHSVPLLPPPLQSRLTWSSRSASSSRSRRRSAMPR